MKHSAGKFVSLTFATLSALFYLAAGAASVQAQQAAPAQAPAATAPQPVAPASLVMPQYGAGVHLGVASCAGSTCHGAVEPFKNSNVLQNEYVTWTRQDKHAKAYKVLLEERSIRIAKNLGLPAAHTADVCLDCHADNVPEPRRGRTFQMSDGVGCESCHGGASGYLGIHISGGSHQDNVKAGLYPTDDPIARARLCVSCHFGDAKKFVTHRIMGAGHPRMSIEIDTFTAIQPAHFVVDKDYEQRKGKTSGVQVWAVGQAIIIADIMDGLLDQKRNSDGIFPELVFFDCHACHHPMSNLRWEPRASTGLGPGIVKFNDANLLMLRIIAERLDQGAGQQLAARLRALHQSMTQGREATLREARQIKDIAMQLANRFARHDFSKDDVRGLLNGVVINGVQNREYIEYSAAEQATMAISSLISTMKNMEMINEAQHKAMSTALAKLYDAVQKDEAYKPRDFIAALQEFRGTIPAN